MDPADDDEETPTSRSSSSLPHPRLREAIGEEIRRLRARFGGRPCLPFPFPLPFTEEEDLLEETVYPPELGALLQLHYSLQLEEDRRPAEQMPTAHTETVPSELTAVIQQPSNSEEKDSTMFEKLDLEVDEDEDVVDEDICSVENMAHEEEEADLEREQIEDEMKWMSEECFLAFRKYAEQQHFKDIEYKFGELQLLNQCFSVDNYNKKIHHFNFSVKEKSKNSDIWKPQLYFAEVKQVSGVKHYFCCLLDASDNGNCNGCDNQKRKT